MGLTKRADGYYAEFRVLDDGERLTLAPPGQGKLKRWKVGTCDRRLAQTQEAIIRTGLMAGTIKSPSVERPVLFEDWAEQFLALPEVQSLRTYRRVARLIRDRFIPYFKGRPLASVTGDDVSRYRQSRPVRVGTINVEHSVLKRVFSLAKRRKLINHNPASDVPMPDPRNERSRVLSAEEFARLTAALRPDDLTVFLLGYDCGMRRGEILNLTVDRLRLEDGVGVIVLRAEDTKTKEARVVPLTTRAQLALEETLRRLPPDAVRVFQEPRGFEGRFARIKRRLNLDDFRFHDTRHCARTNLRRAGVDTSVAMKWLGHKSTKMSQRYDAIETRDLQDGVSRLNSLIAQATEEPRQFFTNAEAV